MARKRFQLTEEQIRELKAAYHRCKDGPTRTRYQAVMLYGTGYPTEEIEEITGCSRSSLMGWCRAYREGGVEALEDHRRGGNRAKLVNFRPTWGQAFSAKMVHFWERRTGNS